MLFDLDIGTQGGSLKKFENLAVFIAILFLIPVSGNAAERCVLYKLAYLEDPSINASFAGNKVMGHSQVVQNLMSASTVSQTDFIAVLEADSKISSFERFWIANIVKVTGDSLELELLAGRPDVEEAFDDLPVELIAPVEMRDAVISDIGHERGLDAINAPQAWALGLNGAGSLVCSFDTGVDGDHEALMAKYRGNNGGDSGACWFDPYSHTGYPVDNCGHGTHTMGTMIGSANSDTVGVAPGAEWIAAAVVDRGGGIQRTISDILAAFQWAADPDGDPSTSNDVPDVVNNSWGIPIGYYPSCEATFWEAIDNLEAAGTVCVFAAGNEGPYSGTIRIPADRVSSEFNAFSVGAVDGNTSDLPVAGFSSRGPSGCDNISIKPEVTAPGVAVRSTGRDGGYALMSGTSMAAPHVAGAVAILRQFNPQATPAQIKQALMNSARDLGQAGEDNDYGWGAIDIRRALDFMPAPENAFPVIVSTVISGDGQALPGENFQLGIAIANLGGAAENILTNLSASDPRVEISSGEINFGPLGLDDTSAALFWNVHFSDQMVVGEQVVFDTYFSIDGLIYRRQFMIIAGGENTPVVEPLELPSPTFLVTNYPNPFNSSTLIRLDNSIDDNIMIMIFDNSGRLVRNLPASGGRVLWDGADAKGNSVSAGIYFARVSGFNFPPRKMLLLK